MAEVKTKLKHEFKSNHSMLQWQYRSMIEELQELQRHLSDPSCPCILTDSGEYCAQKHALGIHTLAKETALMTTDNQELLETLAVEALDKHNALKDRIVCGKIHDDEGDVIDWARQWRKKLEGIYYNQSCKVKVAKMHQEPYVEHLAAYMADPLNVTPPEEVKKFLAFTHQRPACSLHQEPKVRISGSHAELAQRTSCQFKAGAPVVYENMPCVVMKVKKERGQCYHALNCVAPCYPKEVTKSIVPTERLSIRTDKRSLDDYLFPVSEMHNPSHKTEKLVGGHCQGESVEMHKPKLPVCTKTEAKKLESCILSVKERNAESGCKKPEGTGSKKCPNVFAVCETSVGCRFGSGKTVWERATPEQRRIWESKDRQEAKERAAMVEKHGLIIHRGVN